MSMGSNQLANLESLSDKRATKSRVQLEKKKADLALLERQHHELSSVSREYQKASDSESLVAPTMLAHRRAFVSRLTEKIDVLTQKRTEQRQALTEKQKEHQLHSAQSAAISAVIDRRTREATMESARRDQSLQDESFRSNTNLSNSMKAGESDE